MLLRMCLVLLAIMTIAVVAQESPPVERRQRSLEQVIYQQVGYINLKRSGLRLAVYPIAGPESLRPLRQKLRMLIQETLVRQGATVVSRDLLEALLIEQKIQMSHAFDQTVATRMGKILGANAMIIGSIAADQEGLALDLTLVEVETGRLLRQRRELLPSQAVGKPEDSVHFQNGRVFQQRGDWAKAIVCFTQAIEERGTWPLYLVQRGICQHKLRQWDAAFSDYDQALALDPEYADAYFRRAMTREAVGKLDQAASDYETAILHNPDYAEAYSNLGNLHQRAGRYEQALGQHRQAVSLQPAKPFLRFNLACAYALANQPDAALDELAQALQLGLPASQLADLDLDSLRRLPRFQSLMNANQQEE